MSKYIDVERLKAEIDRQEIGYNTDGKHAAEYNTCKKILDVITSLQQEQPEELHFTPLNRLIMKIPSERWNNTVNNYARKLRDCLIREGYRKDAEVLQGYISYMNGNNVPMATMDEQEQPDLEKEIEEYCGDRNVRPIPDLMEQVARHFYSLGLNAIKEE